MYDTSLINSGFTLENPGHFSERMFQMVKMGLGIEEEVTPDPDMPDLEPNASSDSSEPQEEEEMEQVD